ncbi:preprotein translocase subunit SecG [uncultured Clostridium sp.]|uniref:preprotein translocase subunit SecG n=1 Tax=Clostridium bornimense TaxID=1216932 RepID=UPI0025EB80D6|nr:preprotein translocase subunit SecG [uncultured Clostridium sp.]
MKWVLISALVILSIVMIVLVLMQPGKTDGLKSLTGGQDTFFTKHKTKTKELMLERATLVVALLLGIVILMMQGPQ